MSGDGGLQVQVSKFQVLLSNFSLKRLSPSVSQGALNGLPSSLRGSGSLFVIDG